MPYFEHNTSQQKLATISGELTDICRAEEPDIDRQLEEITEQLLVSKQRYEAQCRELLLKTLKVVGSKEEPKQLGSGIWLGNLMFRTYAEALAFSLQMRCFLGLEAEVPF